jgi:uncharacterized protein
MTLHTVRRKDRAQDDAWIATFLERAAYGHLAVTVEQQPLVNMNIFVYDMAVHAIYFHTARRGTTRTALENGTPACFSVAEMGRILPAKRALEFSVEYAGVVAFGEARVVHDTAEAEHALALLMAKYAPHLHPGTDYEPTTTDDLKRTSVYRLSINAWSGKAKTAPPDFPDAYAYFRR